MINLEEWLAFDESYRDLRDLNAVSVGLVTGARLMADGLRELGSYRQFVLFGCACCRRLEQRLVYGPMAIEVIEAYADGLGTLEETEEAREADDLVPDLGWPDREQRIASRAVTHILSGEAAHHAAFAFDDPTAERHAQYRLLLDIFDHPSPQSTIDPVWLVWGDGSVKSIAESIYRDRRFVELPILGDALEDAGCTDATLLDHCRSTGPHVRGCWVIDRLLGYS